MFFHRISASKVRLTKDAQITLASLLGYLRTELELTAEACDQVRVPHNGIFPEQLSGSARDRIAVIDNLLGRLQQDWDLIRLDLAARIVQPINQGTEKRTGSSQCRSHR